MTRPPNFKPHHLKRRTVMGGLASLPLLPALPRAASAQALPRFEGPNVIIIRFGGGVRRQEVLERETTYAPWFANELMPTGTLYDNMRIGQVGQDEAVAGHGHGTLYILTGKYHAYEDIGKQAFSSRFEAVAPTLFELLRARYDIPAHQAMIVNGEDRVQEEFYSFSNHHLFGVNYRSEVLSLFRYKAWLLKKQIDAGDAALKDMSLEEATRKLAEMESLDYRKIKGEALGQAPQINRFWEVWRSYYGESGLVNERGDRLLADLAIKAMRALRPRLMMVNFNDPDYVHWGMTHHYTRGISIIDQCLRNIHTEMRQNPFYRDNTIFVVVPDCGRDSNPLMRVPMQHHFNTASSRQIFCLLTGPGVAAGQRISRSVEQTEIAGTIGALMGFEAPQADRNSLHEAIA
ncbi:MAG: hypothetical protein Alpg2KO_32670 [Alphaproteobacteria bacterium]